MIYPFKIKALVFSFICFSIVLTTNAQTSKVQFGLRAGVTASVFAAYKTSQRMGGSSYIGSDRPLINPLGGITADISLSNDLVIQTGLFYMGKGGRKTHSYGNEDTRVYYAELPAVIVKKFGSKSSFYAGAGVYTSYLASNMPKDRTYFGLGEPIDPPVYENRFDRLDFGLKFAAGYLPSKRISVDLGYGFGLNNILKSDSDNWLANQSLFLGLGYKFN